MGTLSRFSLPSSVASTTLVMHILERPELVAAIRELPGAALGRLIDRIGLEDAGELVALASTAQLERILDDDLWQADSAGGDETFRPERFALWLRVMLEGGTEHLVQRLSELPQDLLALAVHRLVLVLDMDVLAETLSVAGPEAEPIEHALESSTFEEWEEFRLIARDINVWDDVWNALLSLDRDHHDRLRAILEQCCAMSTEYISGQGGLFQVLTSDEMLESDVAATREDRRGAEGFISPADARAFLALAKRGEEGDARDPITRAYFRGLESTPSGQARRSGRGSKPGRAPSSSIPQRAGAADLSTLVALPPGTAVAKGGQLAPLFEQAMNDLRDSDPDLFSTRVLELGYLVNVWLAGGAHEGRRPRPIEALELVLKTCEAGLRAQVAAGSPTAEQALAVLVQTPADRLFRLGFR